MDRQLREALGTTTGDILYAEHHESHAASAFFPSPFEEAAILTMDGVGEWATASIGVGTGNDIELLKELHWPDSLGLLYSAFTYYTGFKVNSGEYKVMGLAPYGEPKYVDLIYDNLIDLQRGRLVPAEPEVLQLPRRPHDDERGVRRAVRRPAARSRRPKLTQREMDLARSVQVVSEEVMLRMARTAHRETGLREPLPGRRRGAQLRRQRADAARRAFKRDLDPARRGRCRRRARRGAAHLAPAPAGSRARDARAATRCRAPTSGPASPTTRSRRSCESVGRRRTSGSTAHALLGTRGRRCWRTRRSSAGSTAGWSSARARWAPAASSAIRAARGCRPQMNLKIKFREGFRPFAPSVLRERVSD